MAKEDNPVLLVDDGRENYEITLRALERSGLDRPVAWCETGEDALDYLRRRGRFSDPGHAPRPVLILLDLNLPGMSGIEVVREIRLDNTLKGIPVVILSGAMSRRQIEACYRSGANTCVEKPVGFPEFIDAMGKLKAFWFDTAALVETDEP